MRLRIEHTTRFTYDQEVSEAFTEMRLRPMDAGGQRCVTFSLATDPRDKATFQYLDRFGNDVRYLDLLQQHRTLSAHAVSEVITPARLTEIERELSPLDAWDFTASTGYAPRTDALYYFAHPHIDLTDVRGSALRLMKAVHGALRYERGMTDVTTVADKALEMGAGVCQDFAHLFIAGIRAHGIPARYVSGYLHDPTLPAEYAATHAWVDVFTPDEGWMAVDPTHCREQTTEYVRLGVGRDYADVPPTRGVFKGGGHETLTVEVRITEV